MAIKNLREIIEKSGFKKSKYFYLYHTLMCVEHFYNAIIITKSTVWV